MDEAQFREWLIQRGANEEIAGSIVNLFKRTEKQSDSILGEHGGISMSEWLETAIMDASGSDFDQIIWLVLGLAECSISLLEMSE